MRVIHLCIVVNKMSCIVFCSVQTFGSEGSAQSWILIGIGLLVGSTVMLLTVVWVSRIIVVKTNLSENATSIYLQDNKRFGLFGMF